MFVRELRRERDYERPDWNSQVGNMIPAWMLADTFLALLVAGALGAVTLLPCAVHSTSEPAYVNQSRAASAHAQQDLSKAISEKAQIKQSLVETRQ